MNPKKILIVDDEADLVETVRISKFPAFAQTLCAGMRTDHSELNVKQLGMTLIEVVMVMIVIGILAAIVIPKLGIPTTSSKAPVDGASDMIASDIRHAQECAMANRVSKRVTFNSGSSTYTFSPSSRFDPAGQLPSGVTTNNNFTITFNSLGEPSTVGGWSVKVSAGGLYPRTISVVNYTGMVNIR